AVVPAEGEATLLVPDYEAAEAAEVWDGALETFPVIRNDRPAALDVVRERLRALAVNHANGGTVGYEGSSETLAPPAQAGEASAVGLPTRRLLEEVFGCADLTDVTELLAATSTRPRGQRASRPASSSSHTTRGTASAFDCTSRGRSSCRGARTSSARTWSSSPSRASTRPSSRAGSATRTPQS